MASFLIWRKDNKEIYKCMPHAIGTTFTLKGIVGRFEDWENTFNGKDIEEDFTTRQAKTQIYVDENDNVQQIIPSDQETLEKIQNSKLNKIKYEFNKDFGNPVECVVGNKTYIMDAGEYSATKLNNGISLAELNGLTTIDLRDFFNKTHEGVSLTDAREIAKQIGNDYVVKWKRKHAAQDEILSTTIDTPDWKSVLKSIKY